MGLIWMEMEDHMGGAGIWRKQLGQEDRKPVRRQWHCEERSERYHENCFHRKKKFKDIRGS